MANLQRYLLRGLIVVLPVGVTIWFLYFAVTKMDAISRSILSLFFRRSELLNERYVFGFSFLVVLILLMIIGWLATNIFGKILTGWVDRLFESVPLVNKIYNFAKQITTSFGTSGGGAFKRTVLVDYPHPGMKALGFVSNELKEGVFGSGTEGGKLAVFIPTSPNPTSGFVVIVDEADVVHLDMTVEEGLKFIVSGGTLHVEEE